MHYGLYATLFYNQFSMHDLAAGDIYEIVILKPVQHA